MDAIVDETVQRIATTTGEYDDKMTAVWREWISECGPEGARPFMRVNLKSQIDFDDNGDLVHNHTWLTRTNREGRVEIVDFSARHYPVYAKRIGRKWHGEVPLYLWEWEDELPPWVSFSPK